MQAGPGDTLTSDSASTRPGQGGTRAAPRRARRHGSAADIEQLRQSVYGFSDLSTYNLRDRLIIRAADIFFYLLIGFICSTLRWEVKGLEHLESITASGRRAIFTFWHTCIFSATWLWRRRGIVVMSSSSRDAEYTGRFIKRFGYGTVRGSSTRGGGRAMAEMAECLSNGMDAAFTIDGPRGPRFVAKPGAITLARHTGQAILPFHIATPRHVALPSWDRLQIPLPFTRAIALIAEPIYVPRDASSEQVQAKQAALQAALDGLRLEADRLSEREPKT
jgi:lysophospholipid acyltransferase (LPLAT)-like uncharacterized protein